MLVVFEGTTIYLILADPNADSPIDLREFGRVMVLKEELLKVLAGIVVTPSGIVMLFNLVHPLKIDHPASVSDTG